MRKFIPTYSHAVIDYVLVIILLAGPYISGFQGLTVAATVSFISGGLVALLSIFTANKGGLVRVLPMKIHLMLDIMLGIFLMLSPFILQFSSEMYFFHVFTGAIILGSAIYTRSNVIRTGTPVEKHTA